jgi:flagellar hook protein FlgE
MEFSPDFLGGGAPPGSIGLDFGTHFNGTSWENESLTTTQFSRSSTTVFQSANGYGAGDFEGITVDVSGVIEGRYSNGESIPLFRVAEARFVNPQGLRKEGGNLYRETRQSGEAATGIPGTNGLGRIAPQSLEMSNVDMAKEITDTIPLQRGYEANLTVIKTKDEMLGSLLDILG